MEYKVVTKPTDEGVSVWVPGLPGCWSEGATEAEALANIEEAIADYLVVADQIARRETGATSHTVRVNVA
jgi:predicted RNase H-like HicB family nuclease